MGEQNGHIILKVPATVFGKFKDVKTNLDLTKAFYSLADNCGFDASFVDRNEGTFDEYQSGSNLIYIQHELSIWSEFSESITSTATGLEYYAKHKDDYAYYLYFLNHAGQRFNLEYAVDDNTDYYREEISIWNDSIPVSISQSFPMILAE